MTDRTETVLGVPYRRLWTAAGLSNLADGIVKVALPLIAIRYTDSPALVAGLAVALTLPWLLFALPAGALADRLDRRRAMLAANTVRAALLAALALAAQVRTFDGHGRTADGHHVELLANVGDPADAAPAAAAGAPVAAQPRQEAEAIDLMEAAGGAVAKRALPALGVLALLAVLFAVLRRRR
jgi:MFS family permease